jgi:hypothetical protein
MATLVSERFAGTDRFKVHYVFGDTYFVVDA